MPMQFNHCLNYWICISFHICLLHHPSSLLGSSSKGIKKKKKNNKVGTENQNINGIPLWSFVSINLLTNVFCSVLLCSILSCPYLSVLMLWLHCLTCACYKIFIHDLMSRLSSYSFCNVPSTDQFLFLFCCLFTVKGEEGNGFSPLL